MLFFLNQRQSLIFVVVSFFSMSLAKYTLPHNTPPHHTPPPYHHTHIHYVKDMFFPIKFTLKKNVSIVPQMLPHSGPCFRTIFNLFGNKFGFIGTLLEFSLMFPHYCGALVQTREPAVIHYC